MNSKDLTGKRFGSLIPIKAIPKFFKYKNKRPSRGWLCKCDCGNNSIVSTNQLTAGKTKSCGCLKSIIGYECMRILKEKGLSKWKKGKPRSKETKYRIIAGKLKDKYDVSLAWLEQFEDIEKLKFLNSAIRRKRDCENLNYKSYIEQFYNDPHFNYLYTKWLETGDRWIKPSLDHIKPKNLGGSLSEDNMQFISWLENQAKSDIPLEQWQNMKLRIHEYFNILDIN